jgi:hypothetical protein
MFKLTHFLLIVSVFFIAGCGSLHKKRYDNGYTFLKHKKKAKVEAIVRHRSIQDNTIATVKKDVSSHKQIEVKKSEKSFQTYHKNIEKINKNAPLRLLTTINTISLKKIQSLKADTLYRKEPSRGNGVSEAIDKKAQNALILAVVSVTTVWFLWFLTLIPAIISLAMVKKTNEMAKLNGQALPVNANAARIIAWVTIGLNAFIIFLIVLYVLFLILLLGTI